MSGNRLNSGALKPSFRELFPPLIISHPLPPIFDRRAAREVTHALFLLSFDAMDDDDDDGDNRLSELTIDDGDVDVNDGDDDDGATTSSLFTGACFGLLRW